MMRSAQPRAIINRRSYSRQTFLVILNAALDCGSTRFARQAATSWLSVYPGDLEISLLLAKAFSQEGMKDQAIDLLRKLVQADPEFFEAWSMLGEILPDGDSERDQARACAGALAKNLFSESDLPAWTTELRAATKLLEEGQIQEAENVLYPVVGQDMGNPLPSVIHLRMSLKGSDDAATMKLAQLYHERWPKVLQFALVLADLQLKSGDGDLAVEMLHACAAQDATGKVATSLWGPQHKYVLIWPEELEIDLDMPVPAEVAGLLGWNALTSGQQTLQQNANNATNADAPGEEANSGVADDRGETREDAGAADEPASEDADTAKTINEIPEEMRAKIPAQREPKQLEQALKPVQDAFEKIAKKLKRPSLAKTDGRYPVYVILSTVSGLNKQYGDQTRLVIDREMRALVDVIRNRPGWGAMIYYPDETVSSAAAGVAPIDTIDPWRIKLALMDLDKALAKKGAMIGALLIVGGHEVVPFHSLPNPTDDMDQQVYSDNPYATLDGNYFIPEWPIGRLVGEKGPDAGLLLEQLRSIAKHHSRKREVSAWWMPVWSLMQFFNRFNRSSKKVLKARNGQGFGYSAAVWRRSSLAVFRPIGEGAGVVVSPPSDSSTIDPRQLTASQLGYYNLHGLPDTGEWYGQRDISDNGSGPDYPVALSTHLLVKNGKSPRVIFSEACYGGYTLEKSEQDSIALRFIHIGSLAVVGSTGIAYGSVTSPLIGADLLGYLFWKYLTEGRAVGESLMLAKIELAREMNRRQGYLDSEDQKTLLSFVLYGDPLISWESYLPQSKGMPRMRNHLRVKTVRELQNEGGQNIPSVVTKEVLQEVKEALSPFLPGLDTAKVSISQELFNPNGESKYAKPGMAQQSQDGRVVVTIEKEVKVANQVHHHFARAALDTQGKVVKLAVSR